MAAPYGGKATRGDIVQAVQEVIDAERREIYTALPGRVKAFDPATQRATIEVLHKPRFNGRPVDMPDLVEVPVVMPRGGGFAFTFPLKAGDGVQVMFQSRDMSEFYERGEREQAFTLRTADLSDAVAIPGLEPAPRVLGSYNPDSFELRSEDGETKIEITADGKIALESAGEELVSILDEFMAVMETHTNEGLEHDQAGAVAALRARLAALKR